MVFVAGYSSGAEPVESPLTATPIPPTATRAPTHAAPATGSSTGAGPDADPTLTLADQTRPVSSQRSAPSPTPTPLSINAGAGNLPTPTPRTGAQTQFAPPPPNQFVYQQPVSLPSTGLSDNPLPLYGSRLTLGGIVMWALSRKIARH
jgi:hypothetical protein